MDLQNFIYLLFAAVWISGLIWAGVIAFKKQKGEMMSFDNVHIPMRANRILSISQINGKLDIAILGEKFFETDSYFEDLHDAVLPFGNIRDLKRIVDHIIDVENNK